MAVLLSLAYLIPPQSTIQPLLTAWMSIGALAVQIAAALLAFPHQTLGFKNHRACRHLHCLMPLSALPLKVVSLSQTTHLRGQARALQHSLVGPVLWFFVAGADIVGLYSANVCRLYPLCNTKVCNRSAFCPCRVASRACQVPSHKIPDCCVHTHAWPEECACRPSHITRCSLAPSPPCTCHRSASPNDLARTTPCGSATFAAAHSPSPAWFKACSFDPEPVRLRLQLWHIFLQRRWQYRRRVLSS